MTYSKWFGLAQADIDELERSDFADQRDVMGDTLDPRERERLAHETIHTDEECALLDQDFDDDDIDDDMII